MEVTVGELLTGQVEARGRRGEGEVEGEVSSLVAEGTCEEGGEGGEGGEDI